MTETGDRRGRAASPPHTAPCRGGIPSRHHNPMRACIALVILAALAAPTSRAAQTPDRPNILLVFIDDMGWGDFSCFGNTEAEDRRTSTGWPAEGLRFEQFYVNSPICSPSRTAISTGQYPQRWRITSYLNNRKQQQRARHGPVARPAGPDARPHRSSRPATPPAISASGTWAASATSTTPRRSPTTASTPR